MKLSEEEIKLIPEIYKFTISLGYGKFSLKNLKIILNTTIYLMGYVSITNEAFKQAKIIELVTQHHKALTGETDEM